MPGYENEARAYMSGITGNLACGPADSAAQSDRACSLGSDFVDRHTILRSMREREPVNEDELAKTLAKVLEDNASHEGRC